MGNGAMGWASWNGSQLVDVLGEDLGPFTLRTFRHAFEAEAHCAACHSLDYIVTNSPFLTPAQWQAEVKKMIEAFKAPIDPADAAQITDYLARSYGG
jgi:hypothetical protein